MVKRFSLLGVLLASGVLSGAGLLWMGYAGDRITMFLAATVFGVGVTYFWPTMLGIAAEKYPKGGAFLLGTMGAAGGLFLAYVTVPGMGMLHDTYTMEHLAPDVAAKVVVDGRVKQDKVDALPQAEKDVVRHAQHRAASITFRYVASLAGVLVVLFGGMFLHDRLGSEDTIPNLRKNMYGVPGLVPDWLAPPYFPSRIQTTDRPPRLRRA